MTIGFGKHEQPFYFPEYSKPETRVQFSSTVYWYQTEPHAPLPPLPPAAERGPAPENKPLAGQGVTLRHGQSRGHVSYNPPPGVPLKPLG